MNLPGDGALRDKLTPGLRALLEDAFQRRLAEGGFAALSPTYQRLWQVRLGMHPSRFQNGYL